MKVQNQKSSNYKDQIQKNYFTGVKPEMSYITGGKTLLTLNLMILIKFKINKLNSRSKVNNVT